MGTLKQKHLLVIAVMVAMTCLMWTSLVVAEQPALIERGLTSFSAEFGIQHVQIFAGIAWVDDTDEFREDGQNEVAIGLAPFKANDGLGVLVALEETLRTDQHGMVMWATLDDSLTTAGTIEPGLYGVLKVTFDGVAEEADLYNLAVEIGEQGQAIQAHLDALTGHKLAQEITGTPASDLAGAYVDESHTVVTTTGFVDKEKEAVEGIQNICVYVATIVERAITEYQRALETNGTASYPRLEDMERTALDTDYGTTGAKNEVDAYEVDAVLHGDHDVQESVAENEEATEVNDGTQDKDSLLCVTEDDNSLGANDASDTDEVLTCVNASQLYSTAENAGTQVVVEGLKDELTSDVLDHGQITGATSQWTCETRELTVVEKGFTPHPTHLTNDVFLKEERQYSVVSQIGLMAELLSITEKPGAGIETHRATAEVDEWRVDAAKTHLDATELFCAPHLTIAGFLDVRKEAVMGTAEDMAEIAARHDGVEILKNPPTVTGIEDEYAATAASTYAYQNQHIEATEESTIVGTERIFHVLS